MYPSYQRWRKQGSLILYCSCSKSCLTWLAQCRSMYCIWYLLLSHVRTLTYFTATMSLVTWRRDVRAVCKLAHLYEFEFRVSSRKEKEHSSEGTCKKFSGSTTVSPRNMLWPLVCKDSNAWLKLILRSVSACVYRGSVLVQSFLGTWRRDDVLMYRKKPRTTHHVTLLRILHWQCIADMSSSTFSVLLLS